MPLSRKKKLGARIALLLLASFVCLTIVTYRNTHLYRAPGKLVDIGDCQLHINESGQQHIEAPTVILEAGFACFSLVWNLVQPEISQFAHVYSYDRAGLGWSEKSPSARTSSTMVRELHTLLETVGAPKPYILVGHSFGGIIMQLYANTYPEDVFGLVLVDSSHESILELSNKFNSTYYSLLPWTQRTWHSLLQTCGLETVSNFTGVRAIYLYSLLKNGFSTLPTSIKDPFLARLLSPQGIHARGQEMRHITESHLLLADSTNLFSDKPLTVISRGMAIDKKGDAQKMWPYLTKAHQEVWMQLQKDLVTKSTRGKHVIAEKSGHTIMWSEPELIVEAVKELVDDYRTHLSSPSVPSL
jgi:pimeloyl-ACP methyl ester carboxylesterase